MHPRRTARLGGVEEKVATAWFYVQAVVLVYRFFKLVSLLVLSSPTIVVGFSAAAFLLDLLPIIS
jgi:hypothetical protein